MAYNPDIHHRETIRLKNYDYARNGAYFVTICAKEREPLFGEITDGRMIVNPIGEIVESVWNELIDHYGDIALDAFVVMPNHIHGIIVLSDSDWAGFKPAPTIKTKRHGLSEIIRGFKTFSSRSINAYRNTTGAPVWQRNYYERVIRNQTELNQTRQYIMDNPTKWAYDQENPNVIS